MSVKTLLGIIGILALTQCKPYADLAPIPEMEPSVDAELDYIFETDQKDRKRILMKVIFQSEEKLLKSPHFMAVSDRDSVRLTRVIELYNEKAIKSDRAKLNAGIIYLHGGGINMTNDRLYLHRSSELFQEVIASSTNKKLVKRGELYLEEAQKRLE